MCIRLIKNISQMFIFVSTYVAKTLLSSDLFCCTVTFFDSCVTVALDPLQLLPLWRDQTLQMLFKWHVTLVWNWRSPSFKLNRLDHLANASYTLVNSKLRYRQTDRFCCASLCINCINLSQYLLSAPLASFPVWKYYQSHLMPRTMHKWKL